MRETDAVRNSELHMALLAWKHGDINMTELKKYIKLRADQEKAAAYLKGQLNVLYSLENKLAVGGWNLKYVVQEKIGELKPKLAELQNRDKMSPPLQDGGSTV